jgi:NAD(P)-dependent dehydrogenase (short-subunit alcohol dehydrogenase family)
VTRTALVTGASGAFGTAVRRRLSEHGWRVAGLDLRPGPGDDEVLACDVTDDGAVPEAVAVATERLGGRLDALVNNAGIGGPASAGHPPGERVRGMLDVNLLGSWRVTAAAIDSLVESRGRAVFVASRMSFIGLPLGAAYGVSKRALVAYADALRAEYGTHVAVTCVHPAMVRTPIHDATREAGLDLQGFSREEPLARVVETIVAACEAPRPGRDVAVTRAGRLQLAAARHLPGAVDRVVARLLSKRIAAGDLDEAPLAAGLRARHGRHIPRGIRP